MKLSLCAFRVLVAAALVPAHAKAQPLRSPWDGKPVKTTQVAYPCPAVVHLPPDLVTDASTGWMIQLIPSLIQCGRKLPQVK